MAGAEGTEIEARNLSWSHFFLVRRLRRKQLPRGSSPQLKPTRSLVTEIQRGRTDSGVKRR